MKMSTWDMVSISLLQHLGTHKSMGLEGIHSKALKELAEVFTKPLSVIYQQSQITRRSQLAGG